MQLAQACELEAKFAEEYRAVRLIRGSIAGEASARGEHARELGKQACERINADPSTPPRASQEAHRCRDTAAGHARSLNARGVEPAPLGAGAHRASGRAIG
jgi:hypothetical protein